MRVLIFSWLAMVAGTVHLMARAGHSWFTWAILGGVLGPLSWPLAVRSLIQGRHADDPVLPAADLLVAVAPWDPSVEWVAASVRGIDPPARSAMLVSVLDAEDAETPAGRELAGETEDLLIRCRDTLARVVAGPVDHRLLFGRPPDIIARSAEAAGSRAILLGPSASRLHHLVHGHTRSRLERLTSIPIRSGQVVSA